MALTFLALLLLLGGAVRLTQTFLSPWKLQAPAPGAGTRSNLWNGQYNLNFVILSQSVSLAVLNPKENLINLINIPPQTLIEVPGGFGSWQLRSIYGLGESEEKGRGGYFIKHSLANFLGIPIDGFLKFDAEFGQKSPQRIIEVLRKNPLPSFQALSNLSTDLTLWELVRIKLAIQKIRFDQVKNLDSIFLSVLEREDLPDGTQVYTGDPQKVDSISQTLFDPAIRGENLSIAVFNATKTAQLAQQAKRMIANMGGNVIVATNAQKLTKRSQVRGQDSKTLERLKGLFDLGCSKDPKCDKIVESDLGLAASRAQVLVILGEDSIPYLK